MMKEIRPVLQKDIPALKKLLGTLELFPADMLDEIIAGYLDNPESEDIWFTMTYDDEPISIGYCAPEKLTDRTFNLYAIGISPEHQGGGNGSALMQYIEDWLRKRKNRILIVETSGTPEFERTRSFYKKCGYTQEATIRDFFEEGDDKVVFWKKL